MIYIIPTPIGNLGDITLRALEVLKQVDGIICEDTRRTVILLNHFTIKKPMYVLNDFNESREFPKILQKLLDGQNLALVSDAGTPLISDPGYKLIRYCLENGIDVDSLPGPTAAITALTLSGLPPDKFTFLGYLPEKPGKRQDLLKDLKSVPFSSTYIVYIAPHKLETTLQELSQILDDIEVVIASELTKMHQTIQKGSVLKLLSEIKNPKGEYVLLFNLNVD